ncbi:MAG: 50S ribosomal protein L11 methyltransferase [Pseudolabrys sp.]|jgi:ribosomal protein L11 methyltransferase
MSDSTTVARLICDKTTARRLASVLGEALDADDAVCAAFEDDRGQWQIAVHFHTAPDEKAVRALVALATNKEAAAALTFEQVADADWVAQSLAGLAPVHAGRFVVHGAHDRACVPVNATAIEIEAALAFGTGHHGTTRGCLLALDQLAKRWHARRVLDLGTGSGVLAIAAAKALRTHIIASDIDVRAVDAARANARLNRVGPFITLTRAVGTNAPLIARRKPYDLIFANILLGPLLRLAVPLAHLTAPHARIVLSGLLPAHANAMLAITRAQGLALERRIFLEGWVTLVLTAPPRRRHARSGDRNR